MATAIQERPLSRVEYAQLVDRIRELVDEMVPAGAIVAVISRGDADLVELNEREGWHVPQTDNGQYAGHHPADSADAMAHVEAARANGAGFLLVPSTAFWWFQHYRDFKRHLDRRYQLLAYETESCALYSLTDRPSDEADPTGLGPLRRQELTRQIQDVVAATLPVDANVLVWAYAQPRLLELDGRDAEPFSQSAEGSPGSGLPDEDELIAQLDAKRSDGAQFLLVSATTFSWLDQRPGLKQHLEQQHRLAVEQRHLCRIYELNEHAPASEAPRRRPSILGRLRRG